jgi:hypothetical protein
VGEALEPTLAGGRGGLHQVVRTTGGTPETILEGSAPELLFLVAVQVLGMRAGLMHDVPPKRADRSGIGGLREDDKTHGLPAGTRIMNGRRLSKVGRSFTIPPSPTTRA